MWAVANIGFIVAISTLTGAVAYPIVNVLPGIVSSLWSLFLFREIQGKKNLIFLGIGMLLRILAAVLSGPVRLKRRPCPMYIEQLLIYFSSKSSFLQ